MILVISSPEDPMGVGIAEALSAAGAESMFFSVHDIPGEIRLAFGSTPEQDAFLLGGERIACSRIRAIYHRVGFSNFQVYEEYSDEEVVHVNHQCQSALVGWLNNFPGLVVNRPRAASSNASKPYQIRLIAEAGLAVPATVVTNRDQQARFFYEEQEGEVIFKSISYQRSIVQKLQEQDLDRLEQLQYCPLQLQSYVPGFDVRVHVVGNHGVFASRIESQKSDYRYDKESEIVAWDLPAELAERCQNLARRLELPLAGLDLRFTPEGEVCCFEVNPSPAYGWYENRTGQPISEALASMLMAGHAW
ncbi:MAG: RimK family alpha-L-glutamate ligase [Vulcanimicrobiota bacterium]